MDPLLKAKIKDWFTEKVRLMDIDADLKNKLTNVNREKHPRLDLFVENMCEQFVQADKLCRQKGVELKLKTIQDTVYDMTEFFVNTVVTEAKRMYESDLDKRAREAQAEAVRQAEDFLSGGTDNEYSEIGLINEGEVKVKEHKDEGKATQTTS